MADITIRSFDKIIPMIYAYTLPKVPSHDGWLKIGYTEKQSVEKRVYQQTHTVGVTPKIEWRANAMYSDGSGEYFTDHDFHAYLESIKIPRRKDTEWFNIEPQAARMKLLDFADNKPFVSEYSSYTLRKEQAEFVNRTFEHFASGGEKFLWNAKPRFGKTLSAYDLIQKMGCENVLIVTNRPSIANSWAEDFFKFVSGKGKYCFVSETDALANNRNVMSLERYEDTVKRYDIGEEPNMIAFVSLQDLKGSVYFGGEYDKLKWMAKEYTDAYGKKQHGREFDLLIVDESQEGVSTMRTERAFENINRKHTLYLSGTPFKQLASDFFADGEIMNWSYADEQEAKANWDSEDTNPYETLPELQLYTYQMSNMITDTVKKGIDLGDGEDTDYAFDLNEFFITNDAGKFVHEEEVKKFLKTLFTNEKYPFSTDGLRSELAHTLWILNRVASAKALAKLLSEQEEFYGYKVVLAAGDGKLEDDDSNQKAFDRVKKAIAENEKTITLSVGQLTVGVTIPQWSGVLMLCNMESPSSYMQAAFRAQNPYKFKRGADYVRKERAYIFDFDPARTLIIFDEFANNLRRESAKGVSNEERRENIKRLLNFFPVIGEDSEGSMVMLDAAQVLSIPRKLKSEEVVRRGFMSNLLFRNIANVFGAPNIVQQIVGKIAPAQEEKPTKQTKDPLESMSDVKVDEKGDAKVDENIVIGQTQDLFGDKVYEDMTADVEQAREELDKAQNPDAAVEKIEKLKQTLQETVTKKVVETAAEGYELKPSVKKKLEKQVENEIAGKIDKVVGDYQQKTKVAEAEHKARIEKATTQEEVDKADEDFKATIDNAFDEMKAAADETINKTIAEQPKQVVKQLEQHKADEGKRQVEESVRAHLRGFARTIPSFIMAYGDDELRLANFEEYTEADVFKDVTGITIEDFIFLRDGGDYDDPISGEKGHFDGQLFDEVVFDDSVAAFRRKQTELADYFDETHDEDIFDYIPPQKTNQIFTPRWVVKKMVDMLENENPGCFDDDTHTFADLYMKSGLYITEIVKRLFASEKIKAKYPDDNERIRHILTKQVYGLAPTRIIYLIATNYIFGFDRSLLDERHFAEADAAEASKNGTLKQLIEEKFG